MSKMANKETVNNQTNELKNETEFINEKDKESFFMNTRELITQLPLFKPVSK